MRMMKYVIACMFIVGCASENPRNSNLVLDAGPVADSGPSTEDSGPYVNPYADAGPGTCVGHCGEWDPETLCACDDLCESWGDCCPDKTEVCGGSVEVDAGPGEFPVDSGPDGGPAVEECENHSKCHPGETGVSTHCSNDNRQVYECKDVNDDGCLEFVHKKTCSESKKCVSVAEYEGGDTVAYCAPKPEPKKCAQGHKVEVCFIPGHSENGVCVCVPKHVDKKWKKLKKHKKHDKGKKHHEH